MARFIQFSTKASQYSGAFDSTVGWSAAGMGYLTVTDSGRLIMIDGGFDEDAEALLSLMKEYSKSEKPTIDLWLITHPHGDHYYALRRLAKSDLCQKLCVKKLIYCFPDAFRDRGGNSCIPDSHEAERIASVFGAMTETPATDSHLSFDGLDIHFLYVPEDVTGLNNFNQLSLIFKINGKKQSVMITGDAFHKSLGATVDRFGEDLKADILQMPHHGLCDTGHAEFYRLVGAKTIFIPTSVAGYRSMHSDMYGEATKVNLSAEISAAAVYKAFEGTFEIEI